jgi:hypothetical protein
MTAIRHRLVPAVLVAVLAAASLVLAASAGAAAPCANRLVDDWSDNSRIDGVYDLHCYEDAIDAIPPDIRDYTNAADVISRAFQAVTGRRLAIRKNETPGDGPPSVPSVASSSSDSALPIPLLVLGAMSIALLGAGALGYFSRRRAATELEHADDDDLLG